jgi:hypothetical protein
MKDDKGLSISTIEKARFKCGWNQRIFQSYSIQFDCMLTKILHIGLIMKKKMLDSLGSSQSGDVKVILRSNPNNNAFKLKKTDVSKTNIAVKSCWIHFFSNFERRTQVKVALLSEPLETFHNWFFTILN